MPNPIINRRTVASMAASGSGNAALVTNGLFAHYFSSDFDGFADGASIGSGWFSQENPGPAAKPDEWQTGAGGNIPTISGTRLCKGHKTVRFDGKSCLAISNAQGDNNGLYSATAANYPTGVEFFAVFQSDNDPATGAALGNNAFGTPCSDFGAMGCAIPPFGAANPASHYPFSDGNFYLGFGTTDRPNAGNPTTSTVGAWRCINVTTPNPVTTQKAFLDSEAFFSRGGYTFQTRVAAWPAFGTVSWLGGTANGSGGAATFFGFIGNIAALFYYNRVLSTAERTQMRNYLNANWGTNI